MASDELDDARVLAALGRILADGDPFTAIPLVDPATRLFPTPTMGALEGVFVRFLDTEGVQLPAGSVVTITVDTATGEIDDITFEEA